MSALIFAHLCIGLFLYTLLCNKTVTFDWKDNPRHVNPPQTMKLVSLWSIALWPADMFALFVSIFYCRVTIQTK